MAYGSSQSSAEWRPDVRAQTNAEACLRLLSEDRCWPSISLDSRNPPLQHMAFRAVQVVPKAFKVAEQQLPAQRDETEFSDDAFLHFQDVHDLFKFTTAGSAFDFVGLHGERNRALLKKVELICPSAGQEVEAEKPVI